MGFDILAVRSTDDDQIGDGMFPVPGEGASPIVLEPLDGHSPQQMNATALASKLGLGTNTRRVVEVRKIKANVVITDQRVAVACEKYDKGGGWIGSPGMMIAANAVSKVRAARRSRAKILVGHVRYQWLHSVAFLSKGGLIKLEHLRLGIADASSDPPRPVVLHIELPTNVSSAKVAQHIVDRATNFWLAQGGVPAEHLDTFRGLASSEPTPVESDGSKLFLYRFPFYLPAISETALLADPDASPKEA
jgi:hypothetical protein